eukprot:462417_1
MWAILFVAPSLIVLIILISLHYQKHFKFRCKCSNPEGTRRFSTTSPQFDSSSKLGVVRRKSSLKSLRTRVSSVGSVSDLFKDATRYRCIFTSANNEEFDFFPIAFFIYLLFLIFICAIIIMKCIIFNTYYDVDSIKDFFIDSYNEHFNFNSITNISFNNRIELGYVLDWILIYSIMTISIWESLFSFYRYYTTKITSKTLIRPSSIQVFGLFAIYWLTFLIFFVGFIHFNYWLFIIILLLYVIFNIYWT